MNPARLPNRPYAMIVLVWIVALVSAPVVGVITSYHLAPGSLIGLIVGFVWLLATYKVAYYVWMFVNFLSNPRGQVEQSVEAVKELGRAMGQAIREGDTEWNASPEIVDRTMTTVGFCFPLCFAMSGLLIGLFVGLLLSKLALLYVVAGYTTVAFAFGLAIYGLVRRGYFPITGELFDPTGE